MALAVVRLADAHGIVVNKLVWSTPMPRLVNFAGQIWDFTGKHSEQIKIFSTIFVAGFVMWEYYGRIEEARVNRALSYVAAHYDEANMTARINTRLFWQRPELFTLLSQLEQIEQDIGNAELEAEEILGAFKDEDRPWMKYLSAVRSDANLQSDLHGLWNFYYASANCALSKVCDEEIMCRSFYADVQNFERIYGGYFKYWDSVWLENKRLEIDTFLEVCDNPAYLKPPALAPER